MKYNGVELTPETIQATRQWFADNAQACIDEAESGAVRVNDLDDYREWQRRNAREALAGEWDHSFAFRQRAYWIQTGDDGPALLP